jgi:hypothetical protein
MWTPSSCTATKARGPRPGDSAANVAATAYGFNIDGIVAASLTLASSPDLPRLFVEQRLGEVDEGDAVVGNDHASIWVMGARLLLERSSGRVTLVTERFLDGEELVHPYLAFAAAVFGRWLGRRSFHAGAFAVDGRAWGVFADKEGGKSTTLASLALAGHAVLADDLLVVEGGNCLAGPRCVDLRKAAAAALGPIDTLERARFEQRERLPLADVPAELPLAGWFLLDWGDELSASPIAPARRLAVLGANQSILGVPPLDPTGFLDLAALPAWHVRRPQRMEELPAAMDELLGLAGR